MLTDIYYYNNYRNHLLGKSSTKSASAKKTKQELFFNSISKANERTENTSKQDKGILMTKAYNSEVISYISNIAGSVNELKSATSSIMKEFKDMNRNLKYRGEEETYEIIKDEIDYFVSTYNIATEVFNESAKESNYLKEYYDDISDVVKGNKKVLNSLGIGIDKNNQLYFDEKEFDNMSSVNKITTLRNAKNVLDEFNNTTNEILQVPLSQHMQFKNFNYYFNYKINTAYNDSFKLVETGTLIDIAV